jgi:hypothetical protein
MQGRVVIWKAILLNAFANCLSQLRPDKLLIDCLKVSPDRILKANKVFNLHEFLNDIDRFLLFAVRLDFREYVSTHEESQAS